MIYFGIISLVAGRFEALRMPEGDKCDLDVLPAELNSLL
jgi:hypothetical protein